MLVAAMLTVVALFIMLIGPGFIASMRELAASEALSRAELAARSLAFETE